MFQEQHRKYRMQVKRGSGRGVLGLGEWKTPLRRPKAFQIETSSINCNIDSIKSPEVKYTKSWAESFVDDTDDFREGESLMVKYSYTANSNSPLGDTELSINPRDQVTFVEYYQDNKLWCRVHGNSGAGFVPSSYLMSISQSELTSLPWLSSPAVRQEKAEYKPYKSAYDRASEQPKTETHYGCDICCKDFNGPQPYNMHMKSKAHREEVEAQGGDP